MIAISPLKHNWAVKFLSHVLYGDIEEFEQAVTSGQLAQRLQSVRRTCTGHTDRQLKVTSHPVPVITDEATG